MDKKSILALTSYKNLLSLVSEGLSQFSIRTSLLKAHKQMNSFEHCYVDESIYESLGIVVLAFVFTNSEFEKCVIDTLQEVGLEPLIEEYKSSARMDLDQRMPTARSKLISLANAKSKIAVFFGP